MEEVSFSNKCFTFNDIFVLAIKLSILPEFKYDKRQTGHNGHARITDPSWTCQKGSYFYVITVLHVS